jgi:hypothetical protein
MQPKDEAIRKRTQISKANRTMFAWVAAASVVLGFALVGTIFLFQMLLFNERVLTQKEKTISILKINNDQVDDLEAQVRVLDTNQALMDAKANPNDQAIQVILDALPSERNELALGASLQKKLLTGIPGLTVNSVQFQDIGSDSNVQTASEDASSGPFEIPFRLSVSGNEIALKQALSNLERSIRTIDVTSITIESQGSSRTLTIEARAFYEPARVVELKDKVVK